MGVEPTAGLRRWMRTGVAVVLSVKLAGLVPLAALALGGEGEAGGSGQRGSGATGSATATSHAAPPDRAAGARSPAPTASAAPPPAAEAARLPGDGPSASFTAESRGVRELVEVLRKRDEELARREAEVTRREAAIAAAAKDLNEKIAHLEALTGSAPPANPPGPQDSSARATPAPGRGAGDRSALAADGGADGDAMEELGKIYGAMKAEEAAPLFDRLDDTTVLRIFQHMKQRQISAVLPLMKPEKAVALTELLGGRTATPLKLGAAGDHRASTRQR
jgi:flagellar motility protein MotE (MotC chaperone)